MNLKKKLKITDTPYANNEMVHFVRTALNSIQTSASCIHTISTNQKIVKLSKANDLLESSYNDLFSSSIQKNLLQRYYRTIEEELNSEYRQIRCFTTDLFAAVQYIVELLEDSQ